MGVVCYNALTLKHTTTDTRVFRVYGKEGSQMKRVYEAPAVSLEQFAANEYIAACGDTGTVYKFVCDAGGGR